MPVDSRGGFCSMYSWSMRAVGLISSSRRSSASLNVMPPRMALLVLRPEKHTL